MPQLQVVNTGSDRPDPTGVEKFFSKLKDVYQEKDDRLQIGNLLKEYETNINEENAFEKLQLGLMNSTVSPSRRLQAQQELNEIQKVIIQKKNSLNSKIKNDMDQAAKTKKEKEDLDKRNREVEESEALLLQNGVEPNEAKRLAPVISPSNAKSYGKPGAGQKMDAFDKGLQNEGAKDAAALRKKIPEYNDIITNLDEVYDIADKHLRGVTGYAKGLVGSESASKVENLSASTLGGIIKTFNPAGTLPTAKLNWIRDTFAIKATDNLSRIKGKVDALKTITYQNKARDEERLRLLTKYKGLIPPEEEKAFDEQTYQLNNVISDQLAFEMKLKDLKEDDLVEGMLDKNGKKLKGIPKKEAIKLFEQGLITNVPE